jgi:hypothetical protein
LDSVTEFTGKNYVANFGSTSLVHGIRFLVTLTFFVRKKHKLNLKTATQFHEDFFHISLVNVDYHWYLAKSYNIEKNNTSIKTKGSKMFGNIMTII